MRAGIVVDSLGISQLSAQLTKQLNQIESLEEYWDIILFYHTYDRIIIPPKFAMMQEEELWGFDAPVIATSLETADRLLKCPRPTKKFFYVWDLEWCFYTHDIDYTSQVYCNPDIQLIARSQSHFETIKTCWREPVAVIEDFNYEEITSLIKG